MSVLRSGLCLCFFVALAACRREPPPEIKHYSMHGQIIRLDEKDKLATIKHDKIEGWMGAMTMDYPIKNDKDFSALHEGDKIDATVDVQGLDYSLSDIHTSK
jgi:Cu/Ag efflux protein CusF